MTRVDPIAAAFPRDRTSPPAPSGCDEKGSTAPTSPRQVWKHGDAPRHQPIELHYPRRPGRDIVVVTRLGPLHRIPISDEGRADRGVFSSAGSECVTIIRDAGVTLDWCLTAFSTAWNYASDSRRRRASSA